jgi:serine/threonine-protein kinase
MIVDGKGARLSEAPVSVVRDLGEISGSPAVVNGISCMGCHNAGIKPFVDNVRQSVVIPGEAGRKVARLFRPQQIPSVLESDTRSFVGALESAMGPFLRIPGENKDLVKDFPEPVSHVASLYQAGVSVSQLARELRADMSESELKSALRGTKLQELGLGPLNLPGSNGKGNRVPRQMLESKEDNGSSVFQVVASEQGIGFPVNIPDAN